MYISETTTGQPVKANGFRTSPWEQQASEFYGNVITAENAAGVSVQRFPTWECAVKFVRMTLPAGRAVFRAFDSNTREWVNRKVFYRNDYRGERLLITTPTKPVAIATREGVYNSLVAKCNASTAPKNLSKLACFSQLNPHHAAVSQAPVTKLHAAPKPRAKVEQPGVGYYAMTLQGSPITLWRFTTFSAAKAYLTQQGFEI